MSEARDINPAEIIPSDHNPRLVFPAPDLQKLCESIDSVGILVPLTVYEDPQGHIRLIDGERRLRCALELGLSTVPCYVVDGVDDTQELEWMFSIHMMREEWEDGPVAKALRSLAERLGGWDTQTMKAVTGLTTQRLNHYKALADQPDEILDRVISGELPANLIVDAVQRVAVPLRSELPDLAEGRSDNDIVKLMLEKREAGALPDVVALRDLRTMIRVASDEAAAEEAAELRQAIKRVIEDPKVSIEEVYEDTVETRLAAEAFQKAAERFQRSVSHAARQARGDQVAVDQLTEQIEGLIEHLQELLRELQPET